MDRSKLVLAFLVLLAINFRCNSPQSEKKKELKECGEATVRNAELDSLLDKFVELNLKDEKDYAIELRYSAHEDTVHLILTYTVFNFDYEQNIPSMYFYHRGIVVIVYTGMESEIIPNQKYIECFNRAISYLDKYTETPTKDPNFSIINVPPTSNPNVWQVAIVKGKIVSKRILN